MVFYDITGAATECLEIIKLDKNALVLADASFTKFYTYGEHVFIAEDGSIYYEDASGHRYVDLGLPSGTLWATCNVGAESPEDYGYYFAWGEIEPKDTYNWSTYYWMEKGYSGWKGCSKYTFKDGQADGCWYNNGTFVDDNKTELDLEDDAAYRNWGEGWRMLSKEQINELCNSNYVKTEWVTQNGKSGRLITSKTNDASLFLPAVGLRNESSLDYAGSYGCYWSRSLYAVYSFIAYYLYLDIRSSGIDCWGGSYRYYGLSVRPVRVSGSE